MTILTASLLLPFLFVLAQTTSVQCESTASTWEPRKSLTLSEREKIVSTIYEGVDVVVDNKDHFVSNVILGSGTWQPKNLRTMARFVKEGDTVLNIGSHIGLEAVVMGKIVGSKGRLFVFEPYSVSFSILLKNIYLNELGDIATVYNVGAGNKYDKAYIAVDQMNTGGSPIFLNQTFRRPPRQTELVEVDLVDKVLPEDVIVDFALIDVEMMEAEVLQGMKETILRSPNIIIMCQWTGFSYNVRDVDAQKKAIFQWFTEHNFKFYRIKFGNESPCEDLKFTAMTIQDILQLNKDRQQIDVFIVPNSVDPNSVR